MDAMGDHCVAQDKSNSKSQISCFVRSRSKIVVMMRKKNNNDNNNNNNIRT
jgi:putative methionine-R-sulfoxide reductase with GAF domain